MRKLNSFWLGVLLLFCAVGGRAQSVSKVLVVINDNSAASIELGNYYALKRGIPASNICHITALDSTLAYSETINWNSFVTTIRNPILNSIATRGLNIEYIVLTKGIPPVVNGGEGNPTLATNGTGVASTDELLAVSRDYPADPDLQFTNDDMTYIYAQTWVNRFWNSNHHFSRATDSGYIVTRLEGYTVPSIKAMVDRSIEAAYLVGTWIHDLAPEYGFYVAHPHPWGILDADYTGLQYYDFNWDIYTSAGNLTAARIPGVRRVDGDVIATGPSTFEDNVFNVAGYIGWGSNDHAATRPKWNSNQFLPGSIADVAYSSSGYTFNDRNALDRTLIADLVDQGISGASANIAEPFLDAISSPTVLFAHYINEFNLAETFYSAYRFMGWRQVLIGDPLTKVKVPRLIPLTEQVASGKNVVPLGIYQ